MEHTSHSRVWALLDGETDPAATHVSFALVVGLASVGSGIASQPWLDANTIILRSPAVNAPIISPCGMRVLGLLLPPPESIGHMSNPSKGGNQSGDPSAAGGLSVGSPPAKLTSV